MLYAIVDSEGLVVNSIEWDGSTEWKPPAGCSIVPQGNGGIGWSYADGEFVPPVAPVEEAPEPFEALATAIEALSPSIEE
jgi:hypothetical protein